MPTLNNNECFSKYKKRMFQQIDFLKTMKKNYVAPVVKVQEMECCSLCAGSLSNSTYETGADGPGLSKQNNFDYEEEEELESDYLD